jgi:cytochrome P450
MRRIDFLASPDKIWPSFARYRRTQPVLWAEPVQMYCVFRYADIKTCLTSPDFTVEYPFRVSRQVFGLTLLDLDGPVQNRLRRHLAQLLLGRADNVPFAGTVAECVQEAVDALSTEFEFEFVERIGRELPAAVTAEFLGIPPHERAWVFGHLRYLLEHLDGSVRDFEVAGVLRKEIVALVRGLIEGGGVPPGSLLHQLHAMVTTNALAADEAVGLVLLVLAAGVETSTGMLSNTMATFARFPQWIPAAAADEEVLARFVREVVRWEPPQMSTVRFARRDTYLGETAVPAGSTLNLLLGSGNRDESVFVNGDDFDPDRPQRSSLSFGHGPHSCLGTHLALNVATTFFAAFLRQYPKARVPVPVPPIEGGTFRRPAALRVVLVGKTGETVENIESARPTESAGVTVQRGRS